MKSSAVSIRTVVLPGGRIEVSSPQLAAGEMVRVIIQPEVPASERLSVLDILEKSPGGVLFKTAGEADACLQTERDSWER